jgi:RNA recognition motif-containing protein
MQFHSHDLHFQRQQHSHLLPQHPTFHKPTATSSSTSSKHHNFNPCELFVGDLSFFCDERDLYALFEQCGTVQDVRIIRNDHGTRSLMFGFVTMSDVHEARESERLLHGQYFMGRTLR